MTEFRMLAPILPTSLDSDERYINYVRDLISKISPDRSRYRDEMEEIDLLGEGSFGKVFKCKSRVDQKFYAVKQVPLTAEMKDDTHTLTRSREQTPSKEGLKKHTPWLVDEASSDDSHSSSLATKLVNERKVMEGFVMSQLDHSNVLRYHTSWLERLLSEPSKNQRASSDKSSDGLKTAAMLYIQMEICECHSLKRWLNIRDKEGKLDPHQNMAIFAQIVYGLRYIHKSGYFHRDIKPANILLNPYLRSPILAHQTRFAAPSSSRARSPLSPSSRARPPTVVSPPAIIRSVLPSSPPVYPQPPPAQGRTRAVSFSESEGGDSEEESDSQSSNFSSVDSTQTPPRLQLASSSSEDLDNEKDIDFDSPWAYTIANYMAKIGDFGLATKVLSPEQVVEAMSGTPKGKFEFPIITKKRSSPSSAAPCDCQKQGFADGDEPRPCKRVGLRTCGIGTTLYAAPEQLYSHHYGKGSDIFSLGLILTELFSTAESRKDRFKILRRARKGILPPSLVESFPQEAELILQLVNLNPAERPTINEILRHPLLQEFTSSQSSRCKTPVLCRLPLSRSRVKEPPKYSPPLATTRIRCHCNEDIKVLKAMVKEYKETMDQMATKIHAYGEQMKVKDQEMLSLRTILSEMREIHEKIERGQLSGDGNVEIL